MDCAFTTVLQTARDVSGTAAWQFCQCSCCGGIWAKSTATVVESAEINKHCDEQLGHFLHCCRLGPSGLLLDMVCVCRVYVWACACVCMCKWSSSLPVSLSTREERKSWLRCPPAALPPAA